MTKAKSTSALLGQNRFHGITEPVSPRLTRPTSRQPAHNGDEWLHRAGLVISSETRESKGQSWLVSRESSTSLAHLADEDPYRLDDLEEALASQPASRRTSRVNSRAPSTKTSRRGSRTGSRVGFMMPLDTQALAHEDYFDEVGLEPDFVEKEETVDPNDEDEIERLSKVQGFGLGGIVDRLVGWPLFNVDEDSEVEEQEEQETAEQSLKRKQALLAKRKLQLEKTASNSASATDPNAIPPPKQNEDGGWKDAAWLLSVASKVIL
jgi:hypothetical protein